MIKIKYCPDCKEKIKKMKQDLCLHCGYPLNPIRNAEEKSYNHFNQKLDDFYWQFIAPKGNLVLKQLKNKKNNYITGLVGISIESLIYCSIFIFMMIDIFIFTFNNFREVNFLLYLYLGGPFILLIGSRLLIVTFLIRKRENAAYQYNSNKEEILHKLDLKINGSIASGGYLNSFFFLSCFIFCTISLGVLSTELTYLTYSFIYIPTIILLILEYLLFKHVCYPKNKIYSDYLFIRRFLGSNKLIKWSAIINAYIKRTVHTSEYGTHYYTYYLIICWTGGKKPIKLRVTSMNIIIRELLKDFVLFLRDHSMKSHFKGNITLLNEKKNTEKAKLNENPEKKCQKCGIKLNENASFCHKCGSSSYYEVKFCAYCGVQKVDEGTFCYKCGNKLEIPKVSRKQFLKAKEKVKPIICQLCGNEKENNENYCPECGSEFSLSKSFIYQNQNPGV